MSAPLAQRLPLRGASGLDFLLRFLETEALYPDRPPGAVELLGWLELAWEDAPHLLVTGCNDGFVPDSIVGDIYLPEKLRTRLARRVQFKTNEQRFARDAYLLESILQCRRQTGGRVDLFLGKRSQKGEPLRPSRLFFLCPDAGLAARVDLLFRDCPERDAGHHWTPGFRLQPPVSSLQPPVSSLPVTAFRDYLTSPFHFYLRHLEAMRPVESGRMELDAAGFGTLLHEALKRLGLDEDLRHSGDEEEIAAFLAAQGEAILSAWCGPRPSLPIRVQGEAARQRLRAAARVQAQLHREGWRIERVEVDLGRGAWQIDGVLLRGRVDRIDRHQDSGVLRVLDYKTAETALAPHTAHLSAITASTRRDWLPGYAQFEIGDRAYRWKDLQLPLYRLGLAEEFPGPIECGYFNLPKSAPATGVEIWEALGDSHDEAALACARGVIDDVRQGRFWPAPALSRDDEFSALHLGRPNQTIDPSRLAPTSPNLKPET